MSGDEQTAAGAAAAAAETTGAGAGREQWVECRCSECADDWQTPLRPVIARMRRAVVAPVQSTAATAGKAWAAGTSVVETVGTLPTERPAVLVGGAGLLTTAYVLRRGPKLAVASGLAVSTAVAVGFYPQQVERALGGHDGVVLRSARAAWDAVRGLAGQ